MSKIILYIGAGKAHSIAKGLASNSGQGEVFFLHK